MISLVTGVGGKGQVGEAVAASLAARGDTVLVVSRDEREAAERAREIASGGQPVTGYGCDLADAAAVDALQRQVRNEFGPRLDVLVNLAGGWGADGPIAQSDPAHLEKMITINLRTAYLTTRAFLPMLAQARGSVVYFASETVFDGTRTSGVAGYAIAKAGVVALMRSVAEEGREFGIRSNALAPAAIRTATNEASMKPGARFVERDEVAAAVAFLTSAQASAISNQVIRLRPRS
jgi:3-oxoacyl-[acyl-carrier protein] reductase